MTLKACDQQAKTHGRVEETSHKTLRSKVPLMSNRLGVYSDMLEVIDGIARVKLTNLGGVPMTV